MARSLFDMSLCSLAAAMTLAPAAWAGETGIRALLPTNRPEIRAYLPPPAGFNPQTATNATLKLFGFPPRPDRLRNPTAYEAWQTAVSSRNTRIIPVLRETDVQHLPRQPAPGLNQSHGILPRNTTDSSSSNWSGVATVNGNTSFSSTSFYTLWGEFNVPVAQQAFGTCSSTTDYSSVWIGIDGFKSSDVMQAGTEADASCSGGTTHPTYYVWFEWYPGSGYQITNLPISAGHAITMQIVADSTTTASLYVTDETTNTYSSLQFDAPAGTHLIGSSAEWIVERPQVNKANSTLTNYAADFMSNMVALESNGAPVFGSNTSPGNTVNFITMVDSNGNTLSSVYAAQSANAAFHTSGSAR